MALVASAPKVAPADSLNFPQKRTIFTSIGMFDTIKLSPPIPCPECGEAVADLQTKEFERGLHTYRVGMIVRGSDVLSGIVNERLWCEACSKAKRPNNGQCRFTSSSGTGSWPA